MSSQLAHSRAKGNTGLTCGFAALAARLREEERFLLVPLRIRVSARDVPIGLRRYWTHLSVEGMPHPAVPCFRSSRAGLPIQQSGRTAGIRRLQGPSSARRPATFRAMAQRGGSSQWISPSWNWGYAVGDAHNAAAKTRSKLSSPSSRQEWLNQVLKGEVDIAEVMMRI